MSVHSAHESAPSLNGKDAPTFLLELRIAEFVGGKDGWEYRVRFECQNNVEHTPWVTCENGSAQLDHLTSFGVTANAALLLQVFERDAKFGEGVPLRTKWIRYPLPPPAPRMRQAEVNFGSRHKPQSLHIRVKQFTPEAPPPPPPPPPESDPSFPTEPPEEEEQVVEQIGMSREDLVSMAVHFWGGKKPLEEMNFESFAVCWRKCFGQNQDDDTILKEFKKIDTDGSRSVSRLEIVRFLVQPIVSCCSQGSPEGSKCLHMQFKR